MYTPDREINPPSFYAKYERKTEKCFHCEEEYFQDEMYEELIKRTDYGTNQIEWVCKDCRL